MTFRYSAPPSIPYTDTQSWWAFADAMSTAELVTMARAIRDAAFGNRLTYSRKVFLPLTQLCRDTCHYCTFAKAPRGVAVPYMPLEEVIAVAKRGADLGCKEALLTLGERPEYRYGVAAEWLSAHGYRSTIEYVAVAAEAIIRETGLLPHINAGTLTSDEIALLRPVSASMGLMLESASDRLTQAGMPHHGSIDKSPEVRLATLVRLGEQSVPTTTGLLVGIGETEAERIQSLLALRVIHASYGHIQELIIQNFRAKAGTRMAKAPEPTLDDLLRTVALARIIFGVDVSIQVPPNLNGEHIAAIVNAGINDWGGISPLTIDFVNPEAPWPNVEKLAMELAATGRTLVERLTVYPRFGLQPSHWVDPKLQTPVLRLSDAEGLGRDCNWRAGGSLPIPPAVVRAIGRRGLPSVAGRNSRSIEKAASGKALSIGEIESLFLARGTDFTAVCAAADELRREVNGNRVTYVVTRNINYTNVCSYGCKFCAFSKGKTHESLRGKPYDISLSEVARRTREAWTRGATEVCMQGGIHPDYTGTTYLNILKAAKEACPEMHIHAFSPLEVTQGARTLGISLSEFLKALKEEGLGSLPGTAAEILDDEVRQILCPDKLTTDEWLKAIETAHQVGLKTTATIMFGHVEQPIHWARHLARLRALQDRTGGFTEFVPLPFVASEAPIYLKGHARPGPTFRETVLMHAVARIAFHGSIPNIQASWVKLGSAGVQACLRAGVNDLGGTLMNESITRAAGAVHGQEASPETMQGWIEQAGRMAVQRTTLYATASPERTQAAYAAPDLTPVINDKLVRRKLKV
ncbi:MAG: 5-amino-6-(D-ribitylamino)uracil--L-tyrosine 4-hydroxyphenyl transferase CofH [Xanthobacteraceae bacterium]